MSNDPQKTNYSSKKGEDSHGKLIKSGTMPDAIKGGGQSGSGPTGSSRSYPKGAARTNSDLNPMKSHSNGPTYAVGGVGKGES